MNLQDWFEEQTPEIQGKFLSVCREDLALYIEFVFGWVPRPHQHELIAALQAILIPPDCFSTRHPICRCTEAHACDACFNCRVHLEQRLLNIEPPGWGKSDTCIEFTTFAIGRNPEHAQYAFASYNDPIAQERALGVRDAIWAKSPNDVSERFALVFPGIQPASDRPWASDRFYVQRQNPRKDPTFIAAGIHGAINARRLHGLILDDPVTEEIADSPTQLRKAVMTLDKTLIPRLKTENGIPAWVIGIMTPWAEGDIAMTLKKRGWPFLHNQALDRNDKSTWEEGKTSRELYEMRAHNRHAFMLLYMGEITPENDVALVRAPSRTPHIPSSFAKVIQTWDTAEQQGMRNAETVGVTLARGHDDVPYILDVWCGQPSLADQVRIIDEQAAKWEREGLCPSRILVEKKSTGGGVLSLAERYSPYRHLYEGVEVGGRGHKKPDLIEATAPLVALTKVPFTTGLTPTTCSHCGANWADKMIQQCGGYGTVGRDDYLMALCQGLRHLFDRVYGVKPVKFKRMLYGN